MLLCRNGEVVFFGLSMASLLALYDVSSFSLSSGGDEVDDL